jgi:hypothetical protein
MTTLRGCVPLDIDRRLGAKIARKLQARVLRRTDRDDAACTHLLGRGDGKDADRPRPLDDDGIVPLEAAGLHGSIEAANAACQRLRQRPQQQVHVIG